MNRLNSICWISALSLSRTASPGRVLYTPALVYLLARDLLSSKRGLVLFRKRLEFWLHGLLIRFPKAASSDFKAFGSDFRASINR